MNIDVLALKYRPRFFSEVMGQDLVIQTLSNSINLNKLHNAYLFSGTRGMGKTTIARLFAKSLLCHTGIASNPCGKCPACLEIDQNNHLDLIEIDAASKTKVEDTRSILENVQYAPASSRFKIYLIDEVHMLSVKSFNALLKTIEEPPSHVKFLMATTEPEKLPDTILSRCLHFKLASASNQIIISHLESILKKEKIQYDIGSLSIIANNANGSIRDSLSLLEQCIAYTGQKLSEPEIQKYLGEIDYDFIKNIITCLSQNDNKAIVEKINSINSNLNYETITNKIIDLLFKLSLAATDMKLIDKSDTDYEYCKLMHDKFSLRNLQLFYQIAVSSKKDYIYSSSKKDHLIMILLRMSIFSSNNTNSKNLQESESENTNTTEMPDIKSTDTISSWTKSIADMSLTGLTLHLARHSIFNIDSSNPILRINIDKKDIYPKACVQDLISKIEEYYNIKKNISIQFEKSLITPIVYEKNESDIELNERYNQVKDDPDINKIKKIFGADIKKESIKKIIE